MCMSGAHQQVTAAGETKTVITGLLDVWMTLLTSVGTGWALLRWRARWRATTKWRRLLLLGESARFVTHAATLDSVSHHYPTCVTCVVVIYPGVSHGAHDLAVGSLLHRASPCSMGLHSGSTLAICNPSHGMHLHRHDTRPATLP